MKTFLFLVGLMASGSVFAQVFSERSAALGIDHTYRARLLLGGGVAFFDYDTDGDEDLYLTGGFNPDLIYSNNGDGTFTKVTAQSIGLGITTGYNTMGVTTGDIDNDGDRDIFVSTWERFAGSEQPDARSLLFRNNGNGTFTEIGATAGVTHAAFAMGAAFVDFNRDGWLDIYVMNHIRKSVFTTDENGVVNGFDHDCYPNFLYLNNGDLTFSEVGQEMGVANEGCTIAAVATDYDGDRDLDLYLANDFGNFLVPNALYQNNYPAEGFTDVSAETGADVPAFGMGIAAGDFDHDGDFDYYTTNIGRNILIENLGGTFVDISTEAGVENATVPTDGDLNTTGWGTAFFDADNDGWEDLYVANGRIPALAAYATATNDPDKLYRNNGDKTFTDVSEAAGVADPSYTRGMAYGDYDQDGDLDVVTVVLDELGGHSKLYVNETENDHHYVQFKLIGTESNRDAFGSRAWVYAGDLVLVKEIYGGGASHASQHSSVLHFGLGDQPTVDSVRIEWTNGRTDVLTAPAADTRHTVVESGTTAVGADYATDLRISVAPNPFTDVLYLHTETETILPQATVRLLAANGTLLWQRKLRLDRRTEIRLNKPYPPGLYLLEVRTDRGRVVKKILRR